MITPILVPVLLLLFVELVLWECDVNFRADEVGMDGIRCCIRRSVQSDVVNLHPTLPVQRRIIDCNRM